MYNHFGPKLKIDPFLPLAIVVKLKTFGAVVGTITVIERIRRFLNDGQRLLNGNER